MSDITSRRPAEPASPEREPARARRRLEISIDPLGLIGILLLLVIWLALVPFVSRFALPTPWDVVRAMIDKFWYNKTFAFYGLVDTGFASGLLYTIENVAMAVVFGSLIGTFLGLVTARSSLVRAMFDPIALTLGTMPIIIVSPFLLLWLGTDRASAVTMVGFYVAVILYTYAQRAAININPVYEAAARTFGASPETLLKDVLMPGTMPEILGGIRIALAGAWGLETIAELLGSQRGIGKLIESITQASDIVTLFAALLLLGITAAIVDTIIALIFAWLFRWRASPGTGGDLGLSS